MPAKLRKNLLLVGKIALAAALLLWVLSKVHWRDYVVDAETGQSYPVLDTLPDEPNQLLIDTASWQKPWKAEPESVPVDRFQRIPQARDVTGAGAVVRRGFASSLRDMSRVLLTLATAGFLCQLLMVSLRWWMLLRMQEVFIRLWETIRLTFLGQFFNAVVPGTVGGDVVKAWYATKHTPRVAAVLVSVFFDRLLGLIELTALTAVMILIVTSTGVESWEQLRRPAITVAVLAMGLVLAGAFLMSSRLRGALHLQQLYRRLPMARHISAVGAAVGRYRRNIPGLTRAIMVTVVAHIFFVGSITLLGIGLGLETPWYHYFIYVPLIYTLGAIPLTPGGLGLVEGLYVGFFVTAAVSSSEVLVLALLARLIPVLWGIPGALVAVTGPRLPKASEMEAQMEAELARQEEGVSRGGGPQSAPADA